MLGWDWRGRGSLALRPHSCPQVDAQLLTVQKLEEKERALQGSLGGVEKELTLRSQALELNKRKVRQMTWARAWLCCPTQPRSLSDT